MSLLLDALKKAAKEKHKNTQTIHGSGKNESLELELNPEVKQNISQKIKKQSIGEDEFPRVDEPDITHVITTELVYPDSEDTDISEDLDSNSEVEDTVTEKLADKSPENQTDKLELKKAEAEKTEPFSSRSNGLEKPEEKQKEPVVRNDTDKIKNAEVLSELINKSNQYSRKKQIKKNISIAILISLIITGAILYFYIEMQAAKQGIYIANGKIDYKNQNEVTESVLVVKDKKNIPIESDAEINLDNLELSGLGESVVDKKEEYIQHEEKNGLSDKSKPVDTTQIRFTRTKKHDPVHKILLQAYSEFHSKNYKHSEELYKNILKIEKKNRDALLGIAAIAVKQKRYELARQKYNYILSLSPGDSIATAGLIGIDKQADSQLSESRLKFMLKDTPDAAPLHFALGNVYSKEKKWPDAQKSYFSAWSVDDKNSDYAFNLAVSLDHLNKKNQALKFYLTSLKLKHKYGGNFSTTGVEHRINSLKKSLQ